jgi:transcriptional regulator with XRE-family HTH domain
VFLKAPLDMIENRFVHRSDYKHTCLSVNAHLHRVRGYYAKMPKNKTLRTVLGENVTAAMAAKKLRQQEVERLAKKHGTKVHQTTIGRVARAVYPATVDTVEAIANGLGVQPWLLLIPDGADKNFLAILKAWSVSSSRGRQLLIFAAEAATREVEDAQPARGAST